MTDPMQALVQLQSALDNRIVRLRPCEIHKDLSVIADEPNGRPRFTYAKLEGTKVQSISLFALVDPVDGFPCFQMGCATVEAVRGRGFATDVTTKGIDELRNGIKRNRVEKFYVEAIVSVANEPSNRLAQKLLSASPVNCIDAFSGEPALQYLRIVM
jgi:hypothetical protein